MVIDNENFVVKVFSTKYRGCQKIDFNSFASEITKVSVAIYEKKLKDFSMSLHRQ